METLEEQIRKIAREEAISENAALKQEVKILRAALKESARRVDTAEAMELTGIKTLHTLKLTFTPTMKGREYTWSAVEIAEYNARKELTKYKHDLAA